MWNYSETGLSQNRLEIMQPNVKSETPGHLQKFEYLPDVPLRHLSIENEERDVEGNYKFCVAFFCLTFFIIAQITSEDLILLVYFDFSNAEMHKVNALPRKCKNEPI